MAATERDNNVLTELDEPGAASQREPAVLDDLDAAADDDEDDPRPTVVPKFDVEKYARTADEFSEVRAKMVTITDEGALEEAIRASRTSSPGHTPHEAITSPPPAPLDDVIEQSIPSDDSRVVAKGSISYDDEPDSHAAVEASIDALGSSDPAHGDAEVEVGDALLDALDIDEQIAVLRDRLGPLSRVPRLSRPVTELGDLVEDSKTAFAIGFIDGLLPLEAILDVTGLPEVDVLKIFDRLIANGAVVFR